MTQGLLPFQYESEAAHGGDDVPAVVLASSAIRCRFVDRFAEPKVSSRVSRQRLSGEAGLTGLAGLPLYLELWRAAGLEQSVARHVAMSGSQGWSDRQMVSALVLLNLAGGEGLDDLDRLEADGGLCRLVRAADAHGRLGGSGGPRRGAGGGSGRARCPRRMRRAAGLRGFTMPARRRGGKPDGRSSRRRARAWRACGG